MDDKSHYKVSLVVKGDKQAGVMVNIYEEPKVGDEIQHNGRLYTIMELVELMPLGSDFGLLHATCVCGDII